MKKACLILLLTSISVIGFCGQGVSEKTIIDEWATVKVPPPPELKPVTVNAKVTALLILDIQNSNCNQKRRPRCITSVPKIQSLLAKARANSLPVVYSLTSSARESDIREEVRPLANEPIVKSSVDKFLNTDLEDILRGKGIETVILVGTSAHGAVLHTATGAASRGFKVIVPVDGMSASDAYAEQYTAWHLANAPGTRKRTTLTKIKLIKIKETLLGFEQDIIETGAGDLKITFIGHGTLMFSFNGKTIHVDPISRYADYTRMPKADLILVTHEHGDHLDTKAIRTVRKEATKLVLPRACAEKVSGGIVMKNGDVRTIGGLKIEAVPAYNIVHKRNNGNPFHPRGRGNGYVITFGDKRVYVAADTENTPEMKRLKGIDVAFLPMNLPYTMTSEMVADAAKAFAPKVLYPYHYGKTDPTILVNLLKNSENIEVRIRKMK
ncbi:MAG: isochorismatase family protein [Planctomycetota bacterium]|jgi:L-ascorbate metabolism protein UlaG (beta-lactamase superfamily)/nicotinamidase-related amidase